MSKNALDRAVAVVRERYDGSSENAAHTEYRVLQAVRADSRQRNRVPLVALPLVAALLASVAWGTASEGARATVYNALHGLFAASKAALPDSTRPRNSSTRAAPVAPTVPDAIAEPALVEPTASVAPPAPGLAPSVRPARSPAALVPQLRTTAPKGASEAEMSALYRAAHRAQFTGNDPTLAVELWDRYLAAAPNGSLSPEARYNRAIALARLGRNAEAASALDAFARGDYGAYRQSEASALLKKLRPPVAE